jgi:hypothetical protein
VFAVTNSGKPLSSADQGRTWTALGQPNASGDVPITGMMDGMGWMMAGIGLAWLLVVVLLVLGITALVKYLRR